MQRKTIDFSKASGRFVFALICCAVWGSIVPVMKTENELLSFTSDQIGNLLIFAGLRFALAGILLVAFYSLTGKKLLTAQGGNYKYAAILGAFQTFGQFSCYYIALSVINGINASVITGASSFFAIILSCFVFKIERFSGRKLLSCLVGFAGIIVVNMDGLQLSFRFLGEGFALLSTIMAAAATCLTKRYTAKTDVHSLIAYQFVFGGVYLLIAGFAFGGHIVPMAGTAMTLFIYLVAVTGFAQVLWSVLLKHNPVSQVAVFTLSIPIFGVLFSALFLHEAITWRVVLALILVAAGIIMINKSKPGVRQA